MWLVSLIISFLIGGISGYIASTLMRVNNSSIGLNIILGFAGSFVGNALIQVLGFAAYGFFARILVSVVGACIVIWAYNTFVKR
jgi:uncharacterized membrane protein YeaQ/YmgE (transglycosylase-associated protein family)